MAFLHLCHFSVGGAIYSLLKVFFIIKTNKSYLVYLYDQPNKICYDRFTSTSVKLSFASEGLLTPTQALQTIFSGIHTAYGIVATNVETHLSVFRSFATLKRLIHLQEIRQNQKSYYSANNSPNQNFY